MHPRCGCCCCASFLCPGRKLVQQQQQLAVVCGCFFPSSFFFFAVPRFEGFEFFPLPFFDGFSHMAPTKQQSEKAHLGTPVRSSKKAEPGGGRYLDCKNKGRSKMQWTVPFPKVSVCCLLGWRVASACCLLSSSERDLIQNIEALRIQDKISCASSPKVCNPAPVIKLDPSNKSVKGEDKQE